MRTLWTMMATSASTMYIGIPAWIIIRSPRTDNYHDACIVYGDGDVHNDYGNDVRYSSCGRKHSPDFDIGYYDNYDAYCVSSGGDVVSHDVYLVDFCGRNWSDLDSPESIEFNYVCYMDQLGRVSGNWLSTYSCGWNRISTLSENWSQLSRILRGFKWPCLL